MADFKEGQEAIASFRASGEQVFSSLTPNNAMTDTSSCAAYTPIKIWPFSAAERANGCWQRFSPITGHEFVPVRSALGRILRLTSLPRCSGARQLGNGWLCNLPRSLGADGRSV